MLSSVRRITCSCLYRQDLGERRGTGVVLQVNDRAGKKIQVSALLIWSRAVACLPLTFFFFPLGFFFHLFWKMNAFQGLQLSESNECHCSRADLCQLKIWPVRFSYHFSLNPSLFLLHFALVSFMPVTPFVTSMSICLTRYSVLLLPAFPLALSTFREVSASSFKAPLLQHD